MRDAKGNKETGPLPIEFFRIPIRIGATYKPSHYRYQFEAKTEIELTLSSSSSGKTDLTAGWTKGSVTTEYPHLTEVRANPKLMRWDGMLPKGTGLHQVEPNLSISEGRLYKQAPEETLQTSGLSE